jgi:hypothetical protein
MIGLSETAVELLDGETAIATIEKDGREELRVSVIDREGRRVVTLRIWALTRAGLVPTKSGFNLANGKLHSSDSQAYTGCNTGHEHRQDSRKARSFPRENNPNWL